MRMNRVKFLRMRRGYTQAQLAKMIGKPQSYVGRIESEDIKLSNISLAMGVKISKALEVDVESLLK